MFVFAGETLLSPLVMCGPHGLKFLKPVELRLPHCASMTPDGWSFALKSSDSSSGTLSPLCPFGVCGLALMIREESFLGSVFLFFNISLSFFMRVLFGNVCCFHA